VTRGRAWSFGEELTASLIHGAGFVAGVGGLVALVILAARSGDPWRIVACTVFASTVVLLYAASTLYHALSRTRARGVFQVIDHSAIFLLIAGTYTPFALVTLRGPWGWTLFGIVWGLAIVGITIKAVFGTRWPVFSTVLYIGMGWTVVIAVKPIVATVEPGCLAWLVAGGLAYTGGVVFYAWERLRYSHAIWHVFVLAGTACHYVAVARYVA
jgi:hemolysin III